MGSWNTDVHTFLCICFISHTFYFVSFTDVSGLVKTIRIIVVSIHFGFMSVFMASGRPYMVAHTKAFLSINWCLSHWYLIYVKVSFNKINKPMGLYKPYISYYRDLLHVGIFCQYHIDGLLTLILNLFFQILNHQW